MQITTTPRVSFETMANLYNRVIRKWNSKAKKALQGSADPFQHPYWRPLLETWLAYTFKVNGWTEAEYQRAETGKIWWNYQQFPELACMGNRYKTVFLPIDNSVN